MNGSFESALATRYGFRGVAEAMKGSALEALELITTDSDGWPHSAWLSPGEVLPMSATQLAVALWPSSTTTANLERSGMALAELVDNGVLFKARLRAVAVGPVSIEQRSLAGFVCEVEQVTSDVVGYASLLSGPRYELDDVPAVSGRWGRQLEALAAALEGAGHHIDAVSSASVEDTRDRTE